MTTRRFLLIGMGLLAVWSAALGHWQTTAAHPPLQHPMFYDAHYLYPRPWTQAQAAPGLPPPSAVPLHGRNHLSQPLPLPVDGLTMIALDIQTAVPVRVSLIPNQGRESWSAVIPPTGLNGRQTIYLRLPIFQLTPAGATYTFVIAAPLATAEQPAYIYTTSGDKIGGSLLLNEYHQPANLLLTTYHRGHPLASLGQQLIPAPFRLRLQQYKAIKGNTFTLLALATVTLSLAFWLLAARTPPPEAPQLPITNDQLPKLLLTLLILFFGWQLATSRLWLWPHGIPLTTAGQTLATTAARPAQDWRLVDDFNLRLWTTTRLPEPRFITQTDLGAIGVPAESTIRYPLIVPPDGRVRLGWQATSAHLRFIVRLAEHTLLDETAPIRTGERDFLLDLSPWAGQATTLVLETQLAGQTLAHQPQEVVGYWVRPQLESQATWLAYYNNQDQQKRPLATFTPPHTTGEVGLLSAELDQESYTAGETAVLTLRWHARRRTEAYPTLFIHLVNQADEIVAQRDAPPVLGSYPVALWQPTLVITDIHPLPLPPDLPAGEYQLLLGWYNPHDFARWTADGHPDGRVLIQTITIE